MSALIKPEGYVRLPPLKANQLEEICRRQDEKKVLVEEQLGMYHTVS